MSNTIQLMPVSSLLERRFFVPAYQRGYRWTGQQVTDLLDDIYNFAIKLDKSEKEFYCLQPIVVKYDREKAYYEVIDGQQRLTTLRILLVYFGREFWLGRTIKQRFRKDLYEMVYETRPGLADFLDNIHENADNIEFFHVSKAYSYISKWFDRKVQDGAMFDELCESISKTLVYDLSNRKQEGLVQVIWYELSADNTRPIDIFIRINLGKILLNNAELIKALFLQEANFGKGPAAKLMQLEIAQEWDLIENLLQDENFWWFLNKADNETSSHIEFIFDMMQRVASEDDDTITAIIGTDKYRTFRYFSHLFGSHPDHKIVEANWKIVRDYFDTFREWYDNPLWYHYIGFLIDCDRSVKDIYDLLTGPAIRTKEDATNALVKEIAGVFKDVSWKTINDKTFLDLSFASEKGLLRRFFLLFNLEYISRKSGQKNLIYKFPFKAFKAARQKNKGHGWDIEHINAATDNALEKRDDQVTWLDNALSDVPGIDEPLEKSIRAFLDNKNSDGFERLYERIMAVSKEEHISDDLKHRLGNLTLLDAGTNRGYGNALFATKRRIIIDKDRKGTFMPICTKNVFLKYFDGNTKNTWTPADIIAYNSALETMMSKFVKPKTTTP